MEGTKTRIPTTTLQKLGRQHQTSYVKWQQLTTYVRLSSPYSLHHGSIVSRKSLTMKSTWIPRISSRTSSKVNLRMMQTRDWKNRPCSTIHSSRTFSKKSIRRNTRTYTLQLNTYYNKSRRCNLNHQKREEGPHYRVWGGGVPGWRRLWMLVRCCKRKWVCWRCQIPDSQCHCRWFWWQGQLLNGQCIKGNCEKLSRCVTSQIELVSETTRSRKTLVLDASGMDLWMVVVWTAIWGHCYREDISGYGMMVVVSKRHVWCCYWDKTKR